MARTAEFTDEQIVEAGKQLKQAGKRITGFGLRTMVGGGNPQRLLEVWESHESEGAGEDEPEVMSELPIEVADHLQGVIHSFTTTFSDRFTQLAREMNFRAVSASERRVKELTQAAEDKRQQAQAEIADAETAVGKAEDDRDQALAHAQKLQADLDQLKESDRQKGFELAQLRKEHEALIKSSQKAAEQAAKEIGSLQDRAAILSKNLEQARDSNATLTGQLNEARNQIAEQKTTIKDQQSENSKLDRELGKAQGVIDSRDDTIKDLKSQISTQSADLKSVSADLQNAKDQVKDRDRTITELTLKLEQMEKAEADRLAAENGGKP